MAQPATIANRPDGLWPVVCSKCWGQSDSLGEEEEILDPETEGAKQLFGVLTVGACHYLDAVPGCLCHLVNLASLFLYFSSLIKSALPFKTNGSTGLKQTQSVQQRSMKWCIKRRGVFSPQVHVRPLLFHTETQREPSNNEKSCLMLKGLDEAYHPSGAKRIAAKMWQRGTRKWGWNITLYISTQQAANRKSFLVLLGFSLF